MKARITNKEHKYYNCIFKINRMHYDYISVCLEDNSELALKMEDIEVISENKEEDILINCKDLLKIKLNNGIAFTFYKLLIGCIQEKIHDKIQDIAVLSDDYTINRRGIWEKKLFLVINDEKPITVNVIGRKYDNTFNITISDILTEDFMRKCMENMKQIKEEIRKKDNLLKTYKTALDNVLKADVMDKNKLKKLGS